MSWEFSTDPEYQEKLDWARRFVAEEVSALELAAPHHHHTPPEPWLRAVVDPLKPGAVQGADEPKLVVPNMNPDTFDASVPGKAEKDTPQQPPNNQPASPRDKP